MTKSKKENFLLRLADGERNAKVVFLTLNVVALQGAYALALGHVVREQSVVGAKPFTRPEVVGTVALFAVISACSARARAS
eukprot:1445190-Rhodomonas_salina.1